jgi:hypothetical protein
MASKFIIGSSTANQQKNNSTAAFFIKIDKKLQIMALFKPILKYGKTFYNVAF